MIYDEDVRLKFEKWDVAAKNCYVFCLLSHVFGEIVAFATRYNNSYSILCNWLFSPRWAPPSRKLYTTVVL